MHKHTRTPPRVNYRRAPNLPRKLPADRPASRISTRPPTYLPTHSTRSKKRASTPTTGSHGQCTTILCADIEIPEYIGPAPRSRSRVMVQSWCQLGWELDLTRVCQLHNFSTCTSLIKWNPSTYYRSTFRISRGFIIGEAKCCSKEI